jgi:glycosyltransferase involved in cell wall biosynthesis
MPTPLFEPSPTLHGGPAPPRRLFAPRAAGQANLVAWRQIAPGEAPGEWRALGPEPQLLIPVFFPPGWVRIRLTLAADAAGPLEIRADTGAGFGEACVRRVEVGGGADVDCFVRLPAAARALRIDLPPGVGEFRVERLRIESLGGVRALAFAVASKLRLLRKYVHTGPALRRGLALLAHGDFARLWDKLFKGLNGPDLEGREPYDEAAAYAAWRQAHALTSEDRARLRAEAAALADPPLFSLLLTAAGGGAELGRTIECLRRQTYPRWELCAACCEPVALAQWAERDARIRIFQISDGDEASAANAALAAAAGHYVGFIDHGDELAEHALSRLARAAAAGPDMLYADEDRLADDGRHVEPYFKPDWSPELFLSWMYTGRPGFYRTPLVRRLGGFRPAFAPAHEYDLALRLTAGAARVSHVPDILYHRRDGRAESDGEGARAAIRDRVAETGHEGKAAAGPRPGLQRVRFAVCGAPAVSIIIPSACRPVRVRGERTYYLVKCLESVQKSTWRVREVIVPHGPRVPPALAARLDTWGVRRFPYETPFNWARAMNQAAALAAGQHLLFLNDDVEVITPDWIERLLEYSQQPGVGAVGAKLLFPGGRLQHAGVAVLGGRPAHLFYGYRGDHPGYFDSLLAPRNCTAVTGACLMTRADVFRATGGFDESFPLNYNDVDYCLRLHAAGLRVVCTPYARLYHHELGTRPAEARPRELPAFQARWGAAWAHDPFHNPNLSADHLDCRIAVPAGRRDENDQKGPE